MKKICKPLGAAIGSLLFLALISPLSPHAQEKTVADGIRHQVIKKKIYSMPTTKIDISVGPPNHLTQRPKSDISRAPLAKFIQKNSSSLQAGFSSENQTPRYDPSGRIDPFVPLIKDKIVIKPSLVKPQIPVRPNPTPLEKIDLSQLKLTAIILLNKGNRGLVQESSGRGHIIAKNTYIGKSGGRVSEIKRDRVIIEEKAIDDFGNIITKKKALVLPSYLSTNGIHTSVNF